MKRPKVGHGDWLSTEHAEQLRKAYQEERGVALERLTAAARMSTDPNVVRAYARLELVEEHMKELFERKEDD